MKRLLRRPGAIRFGAWLFASYVGLVYRTQRWTHEGLEHARGVWADPAAGPILLLWHQGIPISAPTWPRREGAQELRVLISRSSDGEFITQVMEQLGFGAFRGSRQRENSVGDKGGASALREMVRWLKGGKAVAITPDGPKGPARIMGDGPPTLARLSGAPVLMAGIACKPCVRIRSWDRTIFPIPFGKAAIVYHPVVRARAGQTLEEIAGDWGEKLNAVTDRAETLVA